MTRIAFDVHQKTSTYAYLDPSTGDQIAGPMLTSREEFAKLLDKLPKPWIVALEATRSTPAICAWLRELDCEIHLVDPQRLKGLAEARIAKTDKKDALLILDALEHGYLPEAYLADEQVQMLRELTRVQRQLFLPAALPHVFCCQACVVASRLCYPSLEVYDGKEDQQGCYG